jgi:hypothetical protein
VPSERRQAGFRRGEIILQIAVAVTPLAKVIGVRRCPRPHADHPPQRERVGVDSGLTAAPDRVITPAGALCSLPVGLVHLRLQVRMPLYRCNEGRASAEGQADRRQCCRRGRQDQIASPRPAPQGFQVLAGRFFLRGKF